MDETTEDPCDPEANHHTALSNNTWPIVPLKRTRLSKRKLRKVAREIGKFIRQNDRPLQ
jgi:hypothetical protein